MDEPILVDEHTQPEPEIQGLTGRNEKGQFLPGTTGNPNGRPVVSVISIIKKKLVGISPDNQRSYAEMLADNILQDALEGKNYWDKELLHQIDGMPRQKIGLEGGEEGSAIALKIVNYDDRGDVQTPSLSDKSTEGV